MASQPHPLCPPPLCPTANGGMGTGAGQLVGSPETGDAVLKPPVRPKPRTLPKPTIPAKPCAPPPSPGSRAPRLDFPSAEKINLLAGPKPYSGSNTTHKRLSFSLKSPPAETSNGKGLSPPEAKTPPSGKEDGSPAPVTPPAGGPSGALKGAAPFKVKPVPVAAKPERFPGTTVEEILAKMERPRKEGLRSTFSSDAGSCFGPKGFVAFRRQPSAEGGDGGTVTLGFEAPRELGLPEAQESGAPCRDEPVAGGKKRDGSPYPSGQCLPEPPDREAQTHPGSASRESGSSPAGASCDGDQSGRRRPPSPPGFFSARPCPVPAAPAELPLGVAPGSPRSSAGLAPAPGAPYLPAEHPASAPGSPALPPELPAPCSHPAHTELPLWVRASSPDTPEALAEDSVSLVPAPGAPYAPAEPCLRIAHSPGSPETPGQSPPPSGLPVGLAPGSPAAPTELSPSSLAGQPLEPGPPDAPTELTGSPPVGRPLAPGPLADLSPTSTHSPGAPKSPILSPDTPSLSPKLSIGVSQSLGSSDGPAETPRSPDGPSSPEQGSPLPPSDSGPVPMDKGFQPPQLGLRRASDGVVQLPGEGQGMGVLGGSLAALPRGGPPHCGQPLQSESNWSLSQSFEWAFPPRAAEWEPPRSPIREADDSGLSDPGELDGEGLAPSPKWPDEGSDSEGLRPELPKVALDGQDTEAAGSSAPPGGATEAPCDKAGSPVEAGRRGSLEATCPGGPDAQRELAVTELKGPAVVGEAEALWEKQGRPLLGAPLQLTDPELEPGLERAAPILLADVPRPAGARACQEEGSAGGLALAGGSQEGLRPGEPGSELHPHSRWLDQLLASPPPCADETKRQNIPEPGEPAGPEGLLGWSRKDLCSEFGIRGTHRAGELGWASEHNTGKTDWASETEQDREFGTGTRDWGDAYKEPERLQESSAAHGNWPDAYSMEESCRQEGDFSPGKPDWSGQYNVGGANSPDGEFSTRKLDWSNSYGTGESTQQDKRFKAGQPDWTHEPVVGDTAQQDREWPHMYGGDTDQQDGEFGTSKSSWTHEPGAGDTARQDREVGSGKPDWSHESSVGDSARQDEEFSSGKPDWPHMYGGDTNQKDRESGTCQSGWARELCVGDTTRQAREWPHMYGGDTARQDREFGTSKPDWTHDPGVGDIGDTARQDREFGTSKPDWTHDPGVGDIGDTARQDREFGTSKPDWTRDPGVGDTVRQDREFGTSKPDWTRDPGVGDTVRQDREFGTSKPDWTHDPGVGDTVRQDREFGTSKPDWTHDPGVGDTVRQDREFGTSKPDWTRDPGVGDTVRQDREFGTSEPDWTHDPGVGDIGDTARQDRQFGTSKPDWTHDPGVGDTVRQDREFGTSKPDWTHDPGVGDIGDTARQDREFGTSKPDWTHDPGVGDTARQDREFGTSKPDWTRDPGVGDTVRQDREFGTSKPDWTRDPGVDDTARQDREFGSGKPDWPRVYSGDTVRQDREFGTNEPDWTRDPGVDDTARQDREFGSGKPDWPRVYSGDTVRQDREFGTNEPDWTREYGFSPADGPGKECSPEKPDWTRECSAKSHEQGREWTRGYGVGDTAQQDKDFGTGQQLWTREFGIGDGAGQDGALSPDKPAWLGDHGSRLTDRDSTFGPGVEDAGSLIRAPKARKPRWNGSGLQESKFSFARRDCTREFGVGGAEHESQFGVIGTQRAGGFGLAALEPVAASETLPERAGHSQGVGLEELREAGVGQPDWAGGQGLGVTEPSVSGGWMDWTYTCSMSSTGPSSGLGAGGADPPREPGVGQSDGAGDGTGDSATASGLGHLGMTEAGERQFYWSREFSSGAERSAKPGEVAVGQMDWASEAGIGCGKQPGATSLAGLELHGDSGPVSPAHSGPSLLLEEMLAKAATQRKSPSAERGLPAAPDAHPSLSLREEDDGPRPDGDGAPSPSDAMDGGWPPREARRLSQPGRRGSQLSLPGEEFAFLEDTEVLDSAVYRNRANLGRKRGHRAPAPRPAGTQGLSEAEAADWMFRDSTEPRTVHRESSDEEAAEEPQSRRARSSSATKGIKVPLFPGLSPSALKAKLRGRNRSVEEGAQPGEAKTALPKEPHVQRSKSCKLPGLGGKPLALPPKPEKSSGSDASSPHWLQALKLKKKKS
ncbi:182 kDa tankyrase-1-binding protein isoform X2 [Pelodiscus sinensis]|uniref:182 kDa tankyrase-1-binding protein isoform X2 n=1 Tax=Pelodiscus sinensis TaxID=13735 RepID=UPI003F6CFBE4